MTKKAAPDLLRVAARLGRILDVERCLLVGGLAVGGHGYVRATDDVDFVVDISLAEVRRRLAARGIEATLMRGDVLEGDFPCLRGAMDGVRFDVLTPQVPLDWADAIDVSTKDGPLRLVGLEGLLRLKLRAQGAQDLLDVAVLVLRHPESRARALEIAGAYRVRDRLEGFLSDKRTQATAREERVREEGGAGGETRRGRRPSPPRRRR
jgi:hypothetical protein